jgi:hypothetical protein
MLFIPFPMCQMVYRIDDALRRRRTPGPERGPGVNEVSFHARPHHNVHNTLGVDAGATSPR